MPRWNMTTVPNSGTRYICDSVSEAGYSFIRRDHKIEEAGYDLLWGHFDGGHKNWMKRRDDWPDLRDFVLVRNPVHTLCTRLEVLRRCDADTSDLGLFYKTQDAYIKRFNPHIHRVENTISALGEWLGIELKEGGQRFSEPNDLREAVNAQDADRCLQIAGSVWEWFTQTLSPRIEPLYKDRWGYDFWWIKMSASLDESLSGV